MIYLDNSTKSFLYDVDNIQSIYDNDMVKHHFKMTSEGLSCLDCSANEINVGHEDDSFKMKIDEQGVHIEIQEEGNEKSEVKIDRSGVVVKSTKDTI